MPRTALVTGGAGFIGSHVADALLAEGFEVTVLDNLSSGTRAQVPEGASFQELDITAPEAAQVVRRGGFDVLCHLAAQIDVRRSVTDPLFDSAVNIGGTLNLLEAVRASGARTRFVFSSTGGAIYGDLVARPTPEEAAKDPQSPYGTAKLAVEYYLGYYTRVHGLDAVALRYSNVYGPRQDPHGEAGVVAIFCNRLIDGAPLTVYGDGRQTRDYVFVGDVARANVRAATRPLPPGTALDSRAFNVGTGVQTDVLTLAGELARAAGAHGKLEGSAEQVVHAPARPGEQLRSAVDASRAARLLDWRAEVPLGRGLRETFEWFRGRRAEPGS